jgi:SAM-dependent methyltransferase
VGRWSRLLARELLAWLSVPQGRTWLDGGCGAGALTSAILQLADPRTVKAIDASPGFVAHARGLITDRRVQFDVGDLQALPFADRAFDAAVCGLVLNFVRDPSLAASELARVLRPGGVVGAYVWDYAEGMQFMRLFWDAAAQLDPANAALDQGNRFPLCRPEPLAALFGGAGLQNVEVRTLDISTIFTDFDDFWTPFLGGQGAAPSFLATLDEETRVALRELLRRNLPFAVDGSIALTARAWAVCGVKGN